MGLHPTFLYYFPNRYRPVSLHYAMEMHEISHSMSDFVAAFWSAFIDISSYFGRKGIVNIQGVAFVKRE